VIARILIVLIGKAMEKTKKKITSVDEYIQQYPNTIQRTIRKLRKVIKESAPNAQEKISYNMPAYFQEGNILYFAVFTRHIGFYPLPGGIKKFEKELSKYKQGKGSVQFPIDQPIPYNLIQEIVKYRVKENLAKAKKKSGKK
jgi:uncharacterized protein YdhG (YjbR/CyaY superfamily)